jgi:hypothetical protein
VRTDPDIAVYCVYCKTSHDDVLARWRCDGCQGTVCSQFAIDGRQWNRKGLRVHVLRGPDKVLRVCGILSPVADSVEDIIGPIETIVSRPEAE